MPEIINVTGTGLHPNTRDMEACSSLLQLPDPLDDYDYQDFNLSEEIEQFWQDSVLIPQDIRDNSYISITPNPFTAKLLCHIFGYNEKDNYVMMVFSYDGRMVSTTPLQEITETATEHLAQGVYLSYITQNGSIVFAGKFVKQ